MVIKMNTKSNELLQVYPIIKASREFYSLVRGLMRKDTCEGGLRKPATLSASYNLVLRFLLTVMPPFE